MQGNTKGTILIVDNNEQILWKFQEMLENAGFETTTTWSGHEALDLMKSGKFDLVLIDDYLPDLHSHDFLERANHLPVRPRIVVMFSESLKPDDVQRYKALGVSALVNKRDPARVREEVSFCCSNVTSASLN